MTRPRSFAAGRVQLRVEPAVVLELERLAAVHHPLETGGTLIGHYDGSWLAVVSEVLGPPPDSVHASTGLVIGTAGLKEHLAAIWPERFFLGGWHTHPFGAPDPSDTDHATMREWTDDPDTNCPQPLSIILGGEPGAYTWSVTLYRRGAEPEQLRETT